MPTYYPDLAQRVRAQSEALPALYSSIDFDSQPYRTTTGSRRLHPAVLGCRAGAATGGRADGRTGLNGDAWVMWWPTPTPR